MKQYIEKVDKIKIDLPDEDSNPKLEGKQVETSKKEVRILYE